MLLTTIMPKFRKRFGRALVMALIGAVLLSAWVSAMFLVTRGRNVANIGMSLSQVIGLYFSGAILLSAVVALLHPFRRTSLGRALMGAAVGVVVGFVAVQHIDAASLAQWIVGCLGFAGLGALYFSLMVEPPPPDDP